MMRIQNLSNISFYGLCLICAIQLSGCNGREYHVIAVENPEYRANTAFNYYEDLNSPGFSQLISKYQLDTVFKGEEDEFQRILLLKEWIHTVMPIDNNGDPYPGDGYVQRILDAALDGTGFHCGHFMRVQNAVLNAFGFVTRTIGAGPGIAGVIDSHHGINETWVNSYGKWVLIDAKYNHYFEKDGIPLSALEVREEYLKNEAKDILMIKGVHRVATDFDQEFQRSKKSFARTYTWIEWHMDNNMFTVWPEYQEKLIVYEDEFFRNNTWIWGEKPHWAYGKPEFMIREPKREAIEWTPNTIKSKVSIEGTKAEIRLISTTPNRKCYQMKLDGGKWKDVSSRIELVLEKDEHDIIFRVVNEADVTGPEHRVVISTQPKT
ncbi:MAG: transglutaminase domain-containing protein [Cyclobacteriaceae bacterium]|nr:transglutaminase domain-containing protein [Cyclobacteriaceae bacterium SS2]